MNSNKGVLYELFENGKRVFWITNNEIVSQHGILKYGMDIEEVLEIIDHTRHVIIICINDKLFYCKNSGFLRSCNDVKIIECNRFTYLFWCKSVKAECIYLNVYDNTRDHIVREYIFLGQYSIGFYDKSCAEVSRMYLVDQVKEYHKGLEYYGTRVYKKYHEPSIAIGLTRDHLCDLQIILWDP